MWVCVYVCVAPYKGTLSSFLSRVGGVFWNVSPQTSACSWIATHASSSPGSEKQCVSLCVWVFADYHADYGGIRLTTRAAWAWRLHRKVHHHHHHHNKTDDFMMTVTQNTDFLMFLLFIWSSSFLSVMKLMSWKWLYLQRWISPQFFITLFLWCKFLEMLKTSRYSQM